MAAWPGTLPPPRVANYALTPLPETVRTDMEVGSARVRRRTSARNDHLKVAWRFTDAEMATFRSWFDDAAAGAAGGAAWFTMSLPVGNGGIATQEVRFIGSYEAALQPGLRWSVTAQLEVR